MRLPCSLEAERSETCCSRQRQAWTPTTSPPWRTHQNGGVRARHSTFAERDVAPLLRTLNPPDPKIPTALHRRRKYTKKAVYLTPMAYACIRLADGATDILTSEFGAACSQYRDENAYLVGTLADVKAIEEPPEDDRQAHRRARGTGVHVVMEQAGEPQHRRLI
jgi:hypothetical protein